MPTFAPGCAPLKHFHKRSSALFLSQVLCCHQLGQWQPGEPFPDLLWPEAPSIYQGVIFTERRAESQTHHP